MNTYLVIGYDGSDGVTIWLKIKARGPMKAAEIFLKRCKKELGGKSEYTVDFVIGEGLDVHYQY